MISIDGQRFGVGQRLLSIAEVGMAHDGSLGQAHAFIDAIAKTGATAVKFQTHIASEESSADDRFRVKVFPQDKTRFDYWLRTEFSLQQWKDLANHARDQGLIFLSSPFSIQAVDWLEECGVPAWKVASGELTNFPMLERMCASRKPILVSSGMSSWSELSEAIQLVRSRENDFGVFQCTTSYPCPPEKWGLNLLSEISDRFGCIVGLSDHSGTVAPSVAAVALGARMLEFHVVFSKDQFGPDSRSSLLMDEVTTLVESANQLLVAFENPVDKDQQAELLKPMHDLFTKSIAAVQDLSAGHIIELADLAFLKPGTGISARLYRDYVGRVLRRDVSKGRFLHEDDFA